MQPIHALFPGLRAKINSTSNKESSNNMLYKDFVISNSEKIHKATLQQSENILLGLNCLVPGQVQTIHAHEGQDKFYYVIEGQGEFVVGDEKQKLGQGM